MRPHLPSSLTSFLLPPSAFRLYNSRLPQEFARWTLDLFRLCVALGPVAIYLVMLGALNLSRRSLLVTGTRDAAALGLAVSGLIIVGPLELFFPDVAVSRLGPTGRR